ncbi:hypothetical protein GOP80_06905 [Planococcaceae bacterium Storch 2/2-2]|nr:hypothetical protein [Planococcaceae bacterium Storch 2/2-2]
MTKRAVVLFNHSRMTSIDDVVPFFEGVFHGKAPDALVAKGLAMFQSFGFADLHTAVTNRIASALEQALTAQTEEEWIVRVGTKHSTPSVQDAVNDCVEDGATVVYTMALGPMYSTSGTKYYRTEAERAVEGRDGVDVVHIEPYAKEEAFHAIMRQRFQEAYEWLPADVRDEAVVIFTAHSMPGERSAHTRFLEEYETLGEAILESYPQLARRFAFRSGRPGQKWLAPDMKDVMREENRPFILCELMSVVENIEAVNEVGGDGREVAASLDQPFVQTSFVNDAYDFVSFLQTYIVQHVEAQ